MYLRTFVHLIFISFVSHANAYLDKASPPFLTYLAHSIIHPAPHRVHISALHRSPTTFTTYIHEHGPTPQASMPTRRSKPQQASDVKIARDHLLFSDPFQAS